MSPQSKLMHVAGALLDRGHPTLFKRIALLSDIVGRSDRTDTDKLLDDALQDERSDEPPVEVVDSDGDGELDLDDEEDEEEPEDEDKEASLFPTYALPQKERRRGPHPKDVAVGKPDWWNPR